jgi:hypothetical protein
MAWRVILGTGVLIAIERGKVDVDAVLGAEAVGDTIGGFRCSPVAVRP